MRGLYRDQGVVLRTIKLGETDRIVTILTRGHGRIRGVAKGVRKPGSLTVTSAVRGLFKTNLSSRAEAMALINRSS